MSQNSASWWEGLSADFGAFVRSFATGTQDAGLYVYNYQLDKELLQDRRVLTPCEFRRVKEYDIFVEVMKAVFGPKNRRFARALRDLPELTESRESWPDNDQRSNDALVHSLIRKLNPALRDVYGYNPARVVITGAVQQVNYGQYDSCARIAYIHKALLTDTFDEFFNTWLHEQMHCLQQDMMTAFECGRLRNFTEDERYLIQYWLIEQPNYNNPHLVDWLGQEVHARWVAEAAFPSTPAPP